MVSAIALNPGSGQVSAGDRFLFDGPPQRAGAGRGDEAAQGLVSAAS